MQSHDPVRQISYIRQALSQNGKSIGFFVGAGCPLSIRINNREENGASVSDPLICDVEGLTKVIADTLGSKDQDKPSIWDRIVAITKEDDEKHNNIELLLSKIRSLGSVAGKGVVRGMTSEELSKLDKSVCEVISKQVNKDLPHKTTPYHDLAIWSRSINREYPVHIFTTNYDLLLEQAFEECFTPYFDGFVGAKKAFFDLGAVENEKLLPPRWARLWKLHGSLNWRLETDTNVIRSDAILDKQSYLIYPSHLKYDQSRKMPYLAMLDRLKSFLLNPSALLFICGYSFADEHINDIICRSLEANPTAQVYAFMFGKLDDPKYEMGMKCARSIPNMSFLAFDKGIIGRNIGKWVSEVADLQALPNGTLIKDGEDITFRLGDFSALGTLLREVSGRKDDAHED